MKTEIEKLKVLSLKNEGNCCQSIVKIMRFTKNCEKGICQNRRVFIKRKTVPKPKINAAIKLNKKKSSNP